jgi:hypothetical protein
VQTFNCSENKVVTDRKLKKLWNENKMQVHYITQFKKWEMLETQNSVYLKITAGSF